MESLRGRVQAVLHESDGFNVLSLTVYDTQPPVGVKVTKAAGPLHGLAQIKSGVTIELHGRWVDHRKYGQQFRIETWEPWAQHPDDIPFFLSRCVRGMHDPQVVHAVTDLWGPNAFARLGDDDPLDNTRLAFARDCWKATVAFRDIASLLRDDGLSGSLISAILRAFGSQAREILLTNPYRLMEISGMAFSTADRMGLRLGIPPQDPRRVGGAVLAALREAVQSGHLYLPRGDLATGARHYVPAIESVDESVELLVERKAIIIEPGTGAYLPEWHHYERASAQWLANNLHENPLGVNAEEFIQNYEQASRITLSDDQRQALRLLASNRVIVLTGLPGTGKTTVVRAFVRMFEAAKVDFRLMAPTGIAAKRLAAVTERPASTIHRALRYDGWSWFHDESNRLVVDAVIVDEMSMVDQELLYRLLSSLRPDTIVVFVGDDAQLPSVGPGFVLREMVSCPELPKVRLTTIFRQSDKGDIVLNAHRVNRGEELPLHEKNPESEFQFVPMGNQDDIANLVVEMAAKLKGRNANFQVLSPMYDGVVGVNSLNERLRDRLNPLRGQAEFKRKDIHFRVGDRLMVVQNDYKLAVYNGDVGKLVHIGTDELVVRVHGVGNDPDAEVRFPFDQASKLRLAYAVTVHKCQGSEFDTIIMPLVSTQGRMLQRNLFYTAVTRARKRVWILGEGGAVARAIQNDQVQDRNTKLAECVAKYVSPV
jgi:exodeoxyribonuclease V alpha subunit